MRRLTLKKESLAELSAAELGSVAGGEDTVTRYVSGCFCSGIWCDLSLNPGCLNTR
jgi:hypothetical protein